MSLLLSATLVTASCVIIESKERTASLVVLPPLVIGYEELYNDSPENDKNVAQNVEQGAKGNEIVVEGMDDKKIKEIMNGEIGKLVKENKRTDQKDAIRTVIDVKGRRRSQRGRRRQRIENTE